MSWKDDKSPAQFFSGMTNALLRRPAVQYTDTDPHMLYALWAMESGADPDQSLEDIEGATVAYDKFRPRVSRRIS